MLYPDYFYSKIDLMKRLLIFSFFLYPLLFLSAQGEDGFVSIFNGESTHNWTISTENKGSFMVQDGNLIAKGGRAHIFYTPDGNETSFKNFELKLKVRTTEGSNSGVYFHTQYQKKGWPDLGFEAQVNSTHSDPRKTGSLYGVVNIFAPKDVEPYVVKVGKNREVFVYKDAAPSTDMEWFDYHIIVQDNRIIIKVNGETTVDWTQPEDWTKKRRIGEGTVGIQAHDPKSETHYKDIKLKILD